MIKNKKGENLLLIIIINSLETSLQCVQIREQEEFCLFKNSILKFKNKPFNGNGVKA